MKKTINLLGIVAVLFFMFSCDSMLDPETDGKLNEDGIWNTNKYAFGILTNAYNNLTPGYNRISNAMLAAASDDAICPDPSNSINDFYNGSWGPYNLIENAWENNYNGLRKVNLFFEKIDEVPLPVEPTITGTDVEVLRTRERMKGEAHFLRAFFHFELVKRFGAIPIADKVFTEEDLINIKRASLDSCFQFIFNECDSAFARLPYRYGEEPSLVGYNDAKEAGRATKGAALALKAKAQLFWASPLYNTAGDIERWGMAAQTAKSVIELQDESGKNVYGVLNYRAASTQLSDLFVPNSNTPMYNSEIIFSTEYTENNMVERLNAPISFGGDALTVPTESLVEAFPMWNSGKGIFEDGSGYDSQNPYTGRDPRLAMTVLYNGADYTINDRSGVLETYLGGTDGPNAYATASPTGYYLNKFMSDQAAWDARSVTNSRTWIHLRISDIYLTYAEAILEYEGNVSEARSAIVQLRKKVSRRPRVSNSLSVDEMRKLIRNERRVELAFEEQRFFDIRRWRLLDNLYVRNEFEQVRGCEITKNGDGSFSYNISKIVKTRIWDDKMYFFPIPQDEIQKSSFMIQNPGW